MAFDLDDPTVLRVGPPALGPPVMSLDYRGTLPGNIIPIPPMTPTAAQHLAARLEALEARVAALEQPWYRSLVTRLRLWWRSRRGVPASKE